MKVYIKMLLSMFIINPYLIFKTQFVSEIKLLASKAKSGEKVLIGEKVFIIILVVYFTLFFISLFLSLIRIYFFEIITGIFIIFSSFIYYKPFSIERKTYIDFFPNFDILYVFIIGIIVVYHWFFSLFKAIRNKNYSSYDNSEYNKFNDDNNRISIITDSSNDNFNPKDDDDNSSKNRFDGNQIGEANIECNKEKVKQLFFYFMTQKLKSIIKNKFEILQFNYNNFDIEFNKGFLILKLHYMNFKVQGFYNIIDSNEIRNLKAKIFILDNSIDIQITNDGTISNTKSLIKSIISKLFYIYDDKLGKLLTRVINSFITKGYTFESIFHFSFNKLSLCDGFFRVNLSILSANVFKRK